MSENDQFGRKSAYFLKGVLLQNQSFSNLTKRNIFALKNLPGGKFQKYKYKKTFSKKFN